MSDEFETMYVYACHGQSLRCRLWSLRDLVSSNDQLVMLSPEMAASPGDYVIPGDGIESGLCGQVVIIKKPSWSFITGLSCTAYLVGKNVLILEKIACCLPPTSSCGLDHEGDCQKLSYVACFPQSCVFKCVLLHCDENWLNVKTKCDTECLIAELQLLAYLVFL